VKFKHDEAPKAPVAPLCSVALTTLDLGQSQVLMTCRPCSQKPASRHGDRRWHAVGRALVFCFHSGQHHAGLRL